MSACMLTAALAIPTDGPEKPDLDRGRLAVDELTDPRAMTFDDPETELETLIPDFDPVHHLDDDSVPTLDAAKVAARAIIDNLDNALDDSKEIDVLHIGRYKLFVSGGMSWGDAPTDAVEAIWNTYNLPDTVLTAMSVVRDPEHP